MVSPPVTEDYYMVLQVGQTATLELIIRSYRRLALKLHPDRNDKHDATESFQLLGRAYETLKDESRRRDYDLIYPSITQTSFSPQSTHMPRSSPTSTPQTDALGQAAQIVALQRAKKERSARWRTKRDVFESSILELQKAVRKLEQEIRNLDSISTAEAATEARRNSWGTWLLSPIYRKTEDSDDEKAHKDRTRQERRIERDMKGRRLDLRHADLKEEEGLLRKAKVEVDAADLCDNEKIRVIQASILDRENRKRQEKETADRKKEAEFWEQQQQQWEKRERETAEALRKQLAERQAAAEAFRKQQAEGRAEEQKRQKEEIRKRQKIIDDENRDRQERYSYLNPNFYGGSIRQTNTDMCRHDGWWPKVQGRKACPECDEVWTYLLQCPDCTKEACPKCQSQLRPRNYRNRARMFRRVRTPSPTHYDWD